VLSGARATAVLNAVSASAKRRSASSNSPQLNQSAALPPSTSSFFCSALTARPGFPETFFPFAKKTLDKRGVWNSIRGHPKVVLCQQSLRQSLMARPLFLQRSAAAVGALSG
jgi:hypothetical protein